MAARNRFDEIPADWSRWPLVRLLPKKLPPIDLRHGQVIWLLTKLGYADSVTRHTFHVYIKSLRKFGIPFGKQQFRTKHGGGKQTIYSFIHIMELALTLSLRIYHVIPDSILKEIIRHRRLLSGYYLKAYSQRYTGAGGPIVIQVKRRKEIELRGVYLDLNIKFSGGRLRSFGPPKLLSPSKALSLFDEAAAPNRRFLPLNISILAEQIAALSVLAPTIRRGPTPQNSPAPKRLDQMFGKKLDLD